MEENELKLCLALCDSVPYYINHLVFGLCNVIFSMYIPQNIIKDKEQIA